MQTNPDQAKVDVLDDLRTDPLGEAEKLTGKSYKEDEATTMLGLALQIQKGEIVSQQLKALGDTFSRIPWEDFKQLILAHGFKILHQERFEYRGYSGEEDKVDEPEFIIAIHPDKKLLIKAESYIWDYDKSDGSGHVHDEVINGGDCYGVVRMPTNRAEWNALNCSNGTTGDDINRYFSIDIREGLFTKLWEIERKVGPFLNWHRSGEFHESYMTLQHYGHYAEERKLYGDHNFDFERIKTKQREFEEWVDSQEQWVIDIIRGS